MIQKLFDNEGPVIVTLEKCGQLILLSVLWLLGTVPLVTACASTAALYETVLRTVRGPEGNTARVFWTSFKRYLPKGVVLSIVLLGVFAALEGVSVTLLDSVYPRGVIGVLMVLDSFAAVYAAPVLVRFGRGVGDTLKLSFVLSLQYAHYTLLLLLGTVALAALQVFVFPMALVLFLPGAWCWCSSFLLEKAMSRYSGQKKEEI